MENDRYIHLGKLLLIQGFIAPGRGFWWERGPRDLYQAVWKLLAESTGRPLLVAVDHGGSLEDWIEDWMLEAVELGGDTRQDMSFKRYLAKWPGARARLPHTRSKGPWHVGPDAFLACSQCLRLMPLGAAVCGSEGEVCYLHRGGAGAPPNWRQITLPQALWRMLDRGGAGAPPNWRQVTLQQALWKMFVDCSGHPLRVVLAPQIGELPHHAEYVTIGGAGASCVSFGEYLRGWLGVLFFTETPHGVLHAAAFVDEPGRTQDTLDTFEYAALQYWPSRSAGSRCAGCWLHVYSAVELHSGIEAQFVRLAERSREAGLPVGLALHDPRRKLMRVVDEGWGHLPPIHPEVKQNPFFFP